MRKLHCIFAIIVLLLMPLSLRAQFTIVDADDHLPLAGVYVLSQDGKMLTMSDQQGQVKALDEKVTLSMLSYESKTIDAKNFHGTVELKCSAYMMPELSVGKTQVIKLTAAFRDVVKNFDGVVMYREGLVDYYYDLDKKQHTRRVRACRQYEHPELRKFTNDSIMFDPVRLLDFSKVRGVKGSVASTHGDTAMVETVKGKTVVKDGIMMINKGDVYRVIIDNLKMVNRDNFSFLGFHQALKKSFTDWTYKGHQELEDFVALRMYTEDEARWGKKGVLVPKSTQSDVVAVSVNYITKAEAKAEQKNKTITTDFTLPDCLPAIPEAVKAQVKKLVLKRFREK